MNKLADLPTELLMKIVDLEDSTNLYALSLVNRRFHALVNPMLWHRVRIANNVSLIQSISTLSHSDPPVGESIRIVTVTLGGALPYPDPLPLFELFILRLAQHCHHLSEVNVYLNAPHNIPFTVFLALGACPLESLKITGAPEAYINDDYSALDDLAKFQYLRCLDVRYSSCLFTLRLINSLTQHPDWLPRLSHFSMDDCCHFTDEQAIAFIETHPALETLSMQGNQFTDAFLEAITSSLPNIAHLDLSYSLNFTVDGLRQLVLDSISLEWINLFGCSISVAGFYEFQDLLRDGENFRLDSLGPVMMETIRQYEVDNGTQFGNV